MQLQAVSGSHFAPSLVIRLEHNSLQKAIVFHEHQPHGTEQVNSEVPEKSQLLSVIKSCGFFYF
jgi:hypothetical protein